MASIYGPVLMFSDRFDTNPTATRPDLEFRAMVARTSDVKNEWAFISDDALRSNIGCALQGVHFDVLLCNTYNVYYAPLQMKYKAALVYVASVAEAVLQYMVQMVEEDPRVAEVLGRRWTWIDFNDVPTPGLEIPAGLRTVAGTQRVVQNALDRNTKMQKLIQAAKAVEIIDDHMADELDVLRDLRNRIHIKTLDEPEYNAYTPAMVNKALDALEKFRIVAMRWTHIKRTAENEQTFTANLQERAAALANISVDLAVNDQVEHTSLGTGVVERVEAGGIVTVRFGDGSVRRLMVQYAPLQKTGVAATDDDIPF
jgi:hypothetical protein